MINMFNSYSATKENRETPAVPKKFSVSTPGYQSTPLAGFSYRNLKKQKKILTTSYQDNIDSTSEPNYNTLIEEENWSHIEVFKRDQKLNNSEKIHQCDLFNSPDKELDTKFAALSMVVNHNLEDSMVR